MNGKLTLWNSKGTVLPMKPPLISIIVPTYNRGHSIARALDSILAQTYENTELIVVDDGSNDHTAVIIESYQADNFKFVQHLDNRGAAAARNTGVKAASGSFLAFLDSDDEWLPEKLAQQMKLFFVKPSRATEPDVVFCESAGKMLTKNRWPNDNVRSWILKTGGATWSNMLVKRETFLRSGGFDESLIVSEWWDLVFRMSDWCKFAVLREPLVVNHVQPGERLWTADNRQKGTLALIKKYDADTPEYRAYRKRAYMGIARRAMSAGRQSDARSAALDSIRNEMSFQALAFILFSLVGDRTYRIAHRMARSVART